MNLCIAIPTYNRANRLEKSLVDLLEHLLKSKYKEKISVFVSNNGSSDSTSDVIIKNQKKFAAEGIRYDYENLTINKGFDGNVLNCYEKSPIGYIWFLSDDDNLSVDSIDRVYSDILEHHVSFFYYNFKQEPYSFTNPYIKQSLLYEGLKDEGLKGLLKVFIYPKVSSFVLHKSNENVSRLVKKALPNLLNANYGYIHCALVLQTILLDKKFYLSSFFIGYPDDDFENHIDFPPYVGGELNEICEKILTQNNEYKLVEFFKFETADPLKTSLNTLATFYKGRIVLTPELKRELVSKAEVELSLLFKSKQFSKLLKWDLIILLIKYRAYRYFDFLALKITGKSISKEIGRSESY